MEASREIHVVQLLHSTQDQITRTISFHDHSHTSCHDAHLLGTKTELTLSLFINFTWALAEIPLAGKATAGVQPKGRCRSARHPMGRVRHLWFMLKQVTRYFRKKYMQIRHAAHKGIHGGAISCGGSLDVPTMCLGPAPFSLDWCNFVIRSQTPTILYALVQRLSSAKHPCPTDHRRVLANHLEAIQATHFLGLLVCEHAPHCRH